MWASNRLWIARCQNCQLVKTEREVSRGLLQELPLPQWKWDMVTMDFVTGLPRTTGNRDAIWVIVDRLTKTVHFLPLRTTGKTEKLAREYMRTIVKLHGVPVSIVSDWDPKFTSKFWQAFKGHWEQRFALALPTTPRRMDNPRGPSKHSRIC